MKVRLSEVPVGTCFVHRGSTKKKMEGDRTLSVGSDRRVRTRKIKGDPEVETVHCPLRLFGAGLRRHPETVIEIGEGNILDKRRNPR